MGIEDEHADLTFGFNICRRGYGALNLALWVWDLGLRFGVQGAGFGVWGLWFWGFGPGFGVKGTGFMV